MDQDKVKGKMKDIGGRIERQAGEWTGDKDLQSEGAKDQVKGKAQNAWGKVKDFGRDVKRDVKKDAEREMDRDHDRPSKKDVA